MKIPMFGLRGAIYLIAIFAAFVVPTAASYGEVQGILSYKDYCAGHKDAVSRVTETDYTQVTRLLRRRTEEWSRFRLDHLGYPICVPGGLTTRSVSVTLKETVKRDLSRGAYLDFYRERDSWSLRWDRALDGIPLRGVTYEEGEEIIKSIEAKKAQINGFRFVIITSKEEAYPSFDVVPEGALFVAELQKGMYKGQSRKVYLGIRDGNIVILLFGRISGFVV